MGKACLGVEKAQTFTKYSYFSTSERPIKKIKKFNLTFLLLFDEKRSPSLMSETDHISTPPCLGQK